MSNILKKELDCTCEDVLAESLRKSVKAIHQCRKVAFRIGSYAQFDACEGLVRASSSQQKKGRMQKNAGDGVALAFKL